MVRTSGEKKVGTLSSRTDIEVGGNANIKGSIQFTTDGSYYNYIMSDANGTTIANESQVRVAVGSPPSPDYKFTTDSLLINNKKISIEVPSGNVAIEMTDTTNSITWDTYVSGGNFFLRVTNAGNTYNVIQASKDINAVLVGLNKDDIVVTKPIRPANNETLSVGTVNYRFQYGYFGNVNAAGTVSATTLQGDSLHVASMGSFGGDVNILGNLGVAGSLSVGGTKNASVPSKSYPDNYDLRIRASALESPFWSGIYVIDKITTENGIYEYQLPTYFKEAVDLNHLFVVLTPEGKFVQYYYEIQDDKIIIHSSEDATFTIMVIGRRWDNELIEDVRKEVWINGFEEQNQ